VLNLLSICLQLNLIIINDAMITIFKNTVL